MVSVSPMDPVDVFKVIYNLYNIRDWLLSHILGSYFNPSFKDLAELIVPRASQTLAISMDSKSTENVNVMNLFLENFAMK